jgi:hypothetical protein
MIWSIPALQDTTIYEKDPYRNSGLDQLLDLHKQGDVTTTDLTESRILIKFDLASLSTILSENAISINSISASLKLYTAQESELPKSYTIEAKPVSTNWENGSGYATSPVGLIASTAVTDGATWMTTAGLSTTTWSASLAANSQIVFNDKTYPGGGTFITGSTVSQSFAYKTTDTVDINVTNIVQNWYNQVYTNNGVVLSFNNAAISSSNYPKTLIQFYSSNTNTVFEPQLYISWTGSITYNTGSMSLLTYEDSPILYTRAFKGEFLKDKKTRVLLGSRPRYPRPSFAQNSSFATQKALPRNSYYQIKDAHNDQIIIPYSSFTQINTNASGSYFDFYTTMLYPERYYKFEIKAEFSDITEYFNASDFTFKIIK